MDRKKINRKLQAKEKGGFWGRSIVGIFFSIISILIFISSISFLALGLVAEFGSSFIKSIPLFSSLGSIISEVALFSIFIGISGILIGYLFYLSSKWIKRNDINGMILGLILSVLIVISLVVLSPLAFSTILTALYILTAVFLLSAIILVISIFKAEKERHIVFGFLPAIVVLVLIFIMFSSVSFYSPAVGGIISDAFRGTAYSVVPSESTFSSHNLNFSYPSNWQSVNLSAAGSSFLGMMPKGIIQNRSNLSFSSAFKNNTVSVIIPNSFLVSTFLNSPLLISAFSNVPSLSNLSSNRSLGNIEKSFPSLRQFSMIITGSENINSTHSSLFNLSIENMTKMLSLLNVSSSKHLPVNITNALYSSLNKTKINSTILRVLPSSISLINMSNSVGLELTYSSNIYNLTHSYLPVHQLSLAITEVNSSICFVVGFTLSNTSVSQFNSAFSNVDTSIKCK